MKKTLLFTFDYELFLGERSGSVKDCILDPTERLIEIFSQFKVNAIFFVDTTFLVKLKEYGKLFPVCQTDFESIASQIRKLIQLGHYIYPHIHPHWIDAKYIKEDNQWDLSDTKHYRFHHLNIKEREKVFDSSIEILKDIIAPVNPSYKINGFRAGGWSIQPFEDFKPFFEKHNIKYDFTVLSGLYQFSSAQYFNFSTAPQKPFYHFGEDVAVEKQDGSYTELTSSIIPVSRLTRTLHRLHLRWLFKVRKDHTYGKGRGQQSVDLSSPEILPEKGISVFNPLIEPASVELLSTVKLPVYIHYLETNDYMQFVSHPKMLSNHNLKSLEKFLAIAIRKHVLEFDLQSFINSEFS